MIRAVRLVRSHRANVDSIDLWSVSKSSARREVIERKRSSMLLSRQSTALWYLIRLERLTAERQARSVV